ncbi:MAG: Nif3-like dinuclear metal center hexameric protein [Prevotellaceae bacterium]|nr:Nif3-like dinuclear metal center hexameric protein [Prevotellaceae bacterium]
MKVKDVTAALEQFAPLPLQEGYDNAGLQIGLTTEREVSGVLLCLDVTEKVVAEAEARGCNLIVAHHPLLFRPLRQLCGRTQPERVAALALRADVAVYAAHTNLDNASGGVSFEMAAQLGLEDVRFLQPCGAGGSGAAGRLPRALAAEAFLERVSEVFGCRALLHNGFRGRDIETVALCGGAGDYLLNEAAAQGADCFLTGEVHYHTYFGHENSMLICALGHYESERHATGLMRRVLEKALPGLRIVLSGVDTNPVHLFYTRA